MWQWNRYGEKRGFEGTEDIGLKVLIVMAFVVGAIFRKMFLSAFKSKSYGKRFLKWTFCYHKLLIQSAPSKPMPHPIVYSML